MEKKTQKIIIDVDNTITIHNSSSSYENKHANVDVVNKIKEYRDKGYEIILFSSRNMKTYDGDISKINLNTLPILTKWLEDNNIEYDGIIMGKPWCGEHGFYVDDKSIRPDEFINLTEQEIHRLLKNQ
jgi:capsule biosynthesis phosphatase